MPKDTFFNLPPAKRQRILGVAIDAFADQPYAAVSISRLVAQAGIAKGSFYQYFEDKADLYLYLVDLFMAEKRDMLRTASPPAPALGAIPLVRWLGRAGVDFELSNPKLARISYRALYEDVPLPEATLALIRTGTLAYVRELIANDVAAGRLNPDVDPEAAAFVLSTVVTNIGNYIVDRAGIDVEQLINQERSPLDTPAGERFYDAVLDILEHGIGRRAKHD